MHQFFKMKGRGKTLASDLKVGCFSSPFHFFFQDYEKQMDEQSVEITHTNTHRWGCVSDKKTWQTVLDVLVLPQRQRNRQLRVTHDSPCPSVCVITPRKMTFFSKQSNTNNFSYIVCLQTYTFHTRQAEGDRTIPTTHKFTLLMVMIVWPL